MKTLHFNISINADSKKVWETMLQLDTYIEWTNAAWPGSSYDGEWKADTDIRFIGPDKSGTMAHIDEYRPYEYIGATHTAIILKGGELDSTSDDAKNWVGTKENYTFVQNGNTTEVKVEIGLVNPAWADMFEEGWPKALNKLKEISEK